MTDKELEHIQAVCRGWVRQLDTATDSRLTIPPGGALTRTIEVKITALLTFDNVLIMSAEDAETGVCYAKLIRQPDGREEVFDTPMETIADSVIPNSPERPLLRATQQQYQDAMKRLAETHPINANEGLHSAGATNELWIEKANSEADQQPKYLLYTSGKLLGYSLLERARSDGERSGRFHASDEYFEYADIFAALPQAENDWMEANAKEAYGIFEAENDAYRTRFAELAAQVDELKLYAQDESGHRIEAAEVRIEDLSRHYDDETERWLYVIL